MLNDWPNDENASLDDRCDVFHLPQCEVIEATRSCYIIVWLYTFFVLSNSISFFPYLTEPWNFIGHLSICRFYFCWANLSFELSLSCSEKVQPFGYSASNSTYFFFLRYIYRFIDIVHFFDTVWYPIFTNLEELDSDKYFRLVQPITSFFMKFTMLNDGWLIVGWRFSVIVGIWQLHIFLH